MTKSSTALMSLVAAIPGALLAFLLVMAFLNHADKMGGTLNAIVGVALLCGVATALMPVGVLIFGGPKGPAKPKAAKKVKPKKEKAKKEKPAKKQAKSEPDDEFVDEDADDEGSSELVDDEVDLDDEETEQVELAEDDEIARKKVSDEWDVPDSQDDDDFEFEDALSDDELEFDFDDEED